MESLPISFPMLRCPVCTSRKFHGDKLKKRCGNCGFISDRSQEQKATLTSDPRYGCDKNGRIATTTEKSCVNSGDSPIGVSKPLTKIYVDYHRVAYRFPIEKDNPDVHLSKYTTMKGWTQEQEENDRVLIQRNTKSVVFYFKGRIKKEFKDRNDAVDEAMDIIHQEAKAFQERHNIILGTPKPLSKEVKLEPSFLPAGVMFANNVAKSVYPDGKVEFIDKEKAMEHAGRFVENMALQDASPQIMALMQKFNENLEIHYGVLNRIAEASQPFYIRVFNRLKRIFTSK